MPQRKLTRRRSSSERRQKRIGEAHRGADVFPLLDVDVYTVSRRPSTSASDSESGSEAPPGSVDSWWEAHTKKPSTKGRVSPTAPAWFFNSFEPNDEEVSSIHENVQCRPSTSPFHKYPVSRSPIAATERIQMSSSWNPPEKQYDPIHDFSRPVSTQKMARPFKLPHNYTSAKILNAAIMRSENSRNIFGMPDYTLDSHKDNVDRITAHERALDENPKCFHRICALEEKFAVSPHVYEDTRREKPSHSSQPHQVRPRTVNDPIAGRIARRRQLFSPVASNDDFHQTRRNRASPDFWRASYASLWREKKTLARSPVNSISPPACDIDALNQEISEFEKRLESVDTSRRIF